MKSTLFNMVTVLFCITLLASAGVGGINMLTAEKIAQANAQAETEAVAAVLPDFEEKTESQTEINEIPIVTYTATAGGEVVGYAVKTLSKNGFGGAVKLMVGFDPQGQVLNVRVLSQNETPGLGTKMGDQDNPLIRSIKGQNPARMKLLVKKDGGDVDALTAATISSRAYVDAVARAFEAYKQVALQQYDSDVVSGVTQTGGTAAQEGGNNE